MNAFNLKREWRRSRFATPLDSLSLLRGLFVQSVYSGAVHARFRGIGLFWRGYRICMRYMVGVHSKLTVTSWLHPPGK